MTQSVDDYFTRFQDFEEDPQASLLTEFSRLALDQGWDNRTRAEERRSCLIAQLNVHVGSTGTGGQRDQLARLQRLCEELRVSPIPTSITQCKKVLKEVHVNLVDLIDSRRQRTQVQIFASDVALRQDARRTRRFFPLVEAKRNEDGVLKILLRRMH